MRRPWKLTEDLKRDLNKHITEKETQHRCCKRSLDTLRSELRELKALRRGLAGAHN